MTDIPQAVLDGQEPVAFITKSGIGRLFDVDSREIVSVSRSWSESPDCVGVYLKPHAALCNQPSAPQLVNERDLQAEVDAAAIADFAADLDGMSDDELKTEITSAQNDLDEVEPWLEALHAEGRRRGLCV